MRKLFCLLILIFTACSSVSGGGNPGEMPPIKDVLTLELSFGSEDLPEEYLLANPEGVMVSDDGNIYTADEKFIKVYDSSGRPVTKFGGEGQGPGEFTAPMKPTISPTGYITAMDILWEFNVYRPDHSFVLKNKIKANDRLNKLNEEFNLNFTMMEQIYSVNDNRRLIGMFGQNMNLEGKYPVHQFILDLQPDTLIKIAQYHSRKAIKTNNGSNGVKFQGELLWDMLVGERVVYTETYYEKSAPPDKAEYYLKVYSLQKHSEKTIIRPYTPLKIPADRKTLKPVHVESINLHIDPNPEVQEILDDTEFYPPLRTLKADGNVIFAFLYNNNDDDEGDEIEEQNIVEQYIVDVIDADAGLLIARAEFPFIPDVIRNGYAYRLRKSEEEFPTIEKYRIDPAVYGL
jgi:hypothetical protein